MAYKINYYRQFQDADEEGKLFINTEEYDLNGVYNTIEEAEKRLDSVVADLARYNGVEFGYEAQRLTLWAEDNLYGRNADRLLKHNLSAHKNCSELRFF